MWCPSRLTRSQLEERRLDALPLLDDPALSTSALAEQFGVQASTVRTWRRRSRLQGCLDARPITGRPSQLSDEYVAELIDIIRAGPDPQRFPDQRWNARRVRELIGLTCGIWYTPDWVGKLLRRWGFSWQKSEKRAVERDEARIERWVEEQLPILEQKVEAGETLIFVDEVGFSLKPTMAYSWAPRGETPIIFGKTSWSTLSTIGGIATSGHFLQHTSPGSIKGPQVITFLTHVLRHIPGRVTVLLDHAAIHKTKALHAFVQTQTRLSITYLPPYAPELNPVERVWAYVKQQILANFCPENVSQLKCRLTFAWQRVRTRQLPARVLGVTSVVV
ncbi:IS630 family transposase (plasmid) [Deinococcus sp. KNUC1210]|uniref:IS630 family transposase n=1 Tax=Deinococcus sp. KNUC1210 TaxID=2917691 RepID=UPI001EEFAA63|nr:IS630 family transposase [Deinococcus sp. KNUC1210]ULH17318.1 IS630 family transposase [Deinococcus sp. KNUC1210]ULH17454.1 IS630 family transposase [Deinococcus sp. KNUC1210]